MVKQKLYAINPDSIWCIGARGKCYEAYLGRTVKRSQLRLGKTVEVESILSRLLMKSQSMIHIMMMSTVWIVT